MTKDKKQQQRIELTAFGRLHEAFVCTVYR